MSWCTDTIEVEVKVLKGIDVSVYLLFIYLDPRQLSATLPSDHMKNKLLQQHTCARTYINTYIHTLSSIAAHTWQ